MKIALGLDNSWEIAERASLLLEGGAPGFSGARFERILLADGRRLVLNYLSPEGDWLTRATGAVSRTRLLWDSGILGEVSASDLTEFLLPLEVPVANIDVRGLLGGLAALHRAWEGCRLEGLCPAEARYRQNAPGLQPPIGAQRTPGSRTDPGRVASIRRSGVGRDCGRGVRRSRASRNTHRGAHLNRGEHPRAA
jgi:hypothetical protein